MKENLPHNIFTAQALADKNKAYFHAKQYWGNDDEENAVKWAIQAMRLGSQNLAPKLLGEIAETTRSKSTAFSLASFYWDQKDSKKALYWATTAKEYGSTHLADKLIAEITAHQNALELEQQISQFSN